MALFFKRIGTKKIVYSVDITIHSITLSLSIEAGISIIWKRKKNRIETSNKHKIIPNSGLLEINETLTMINTMYQEKSGDFVTKFAELTVQAHVDKKGKKKVGKIKIDLSEHINGVSLKFFNLKDCADRKASICLSIKFNPVGESTIVETISEGSENSGISMGTEGDYSGPLFHDHDLDSEDERVKHYSSHHSLPRPKPSPSKRKHSIANLDNMAMLKLLQKENEQLRNEKEEFMTQIGLISERAISERDEYIRYVEEIEVSLKNTEGKLKKYKEKSRRYKERVKNVEGQLKEMENEFCEYKVQFNVQEQKKWKESLKGVKKEMQGVSEENDRVKNWNENLQAENKDLKEAVESFKAANMKLLKDIDAYREQIPESEDDHSSSKMKTNLKNLKSELKSAEDEIEDLRSKQTEYISTIHSLKMSFSSKEDSLKSKIRILENDLADKNQELQELSVRLEEEINISKKLERKTMTVQEETDTKFLKLTKNLQEIATEKEVLEQNFISIQRKADREKNSFDYAALAKAEGSIAAQKSEIQKLQTLIKTQDTKIAELIQSKERLLQENSQLQDQIKKVNLNRYSDPARVILQEKIKVLEEKIHENEVLAAEEREKLCENNRVLEKELEIVEKQIREQAEKYEKKINGLIVENKLNAERDKERKSMVPGQLVINMNEEKWKQTIEMLNLKILEYKNENEKLREEVKIAENKYQESKRMISKKETEKETIQSKYREAQDQLREYSSQYTMLEVELYKINERFGQALNMNNQLENELQELKEQIFTFAHGKSKPTPKPN